MIAKYLQFIWGFIGIIVGMVLTIFIPSIQGKWDMTSLAGLIVVILFALVASDRLKEYSERLEKQHDQLKKQFQLDSQAIAQELNDKFQRKVEVLSDLMHKNTEELIEMSVKNSSQFKEAHRELRDIYQENREHISQVLEGMKEVRVLVTQIGSQRKSDNKQETKITSSSS